MSSTMPWTVKKGEDYGPSVDPIIAYASGRSAMTREDWLKLAWAALDQGSTYATVHAAEPAFEAIASMLPENETEEPK